MYWVLIDQISQSIISFLLFFSSEHFHGLHISVSLSKPPYYSLLKQYDYFLFIAGLKTYHFESKKLYQFHRNIFQKKKKLLNTDWMQNLKGEKSDKLCIMYWYIKILTKFRIQFPACLLYNFFVKKNVWGKIGCMHSQKYEVA